MKGWLLQLAFKGGLLLLGGWLLFQFPLQFNLELPDHFNSINEVFHYNLVYQLTTIVLLCSYITLTSST